MGIIACHNKQRLNPQGPSHFSLRRQSHTLDHVTRFQFWPRRHCVISGVEAGTFSIWLIAVNRFKKGAVLGDL
jgi:hypothetical protein